MDLNQFGQAITKHMKELNDKELRLTVLQKNYDAVLAEKAHLQKLLDDNRDVSRLKEDNAKLETKLKVAKATLSKVKEMTSVPRNKAEKDVYLLTSQALPGL